MELYSMRQLYAETALKLFTPEVAQEMIEGTGVREALDAEVEMVTLRAEDPIDSLLKKKNNVGRRWKKIFSVREIKEKSSISEEGLAAFYIIDSLCGVFIPNIMRNYLELDLPNFIKSYDIFVSGLNVTQDILRVTNAPLGRLEDEIGDWSEHYEKTFGVDVSLADQTQDVLRENARTKRLKILFEENPTERPKGRQVVTESVKQMKGQENRIEIPSLIPPFLIPGFVEFGADYAQELYFAVYPHAEEVYQNLT